MNHLSYKTVRTSSESKPIEHEERRQTVEYEDYVIRTARFSVVWLLVSGVCIGAAAGSVVGGTARSIAQGAALMVGINLIIVVWLILFLQNKWDEMQENYTYKRFVNEQPEQLPNDDPVRQLFRRSENHSAMSGKHYQFTEHQLIHLAFMARHSINLVRRQLTGPSWSGRNVNSVYPDIVSELRHIGWLDRDNNWTDIAKNYEIK